MPIEIAGNQPGFKLWAVLSSLVLGVLCLLGGACVLHGVAIVETYDTEVKTGLARGIRIGLVGIAVIWCCYMAMLAWAATSERFRVSLRFLMAGWLLIACWLLLGVLNGWLWTMFGGMRSVM